MLLDTIHHGLILISIILSSALFYGWKNGLKTGSYYIRTRPKVQAQQFTIEAVKITSKNEETSYEPCEMCSA